MSERPIIFSAEMVIAIVEGCKTQTRRAMKIQPSWNTGGFWTFPQLNPNDLWYDQESLALEILESETVKCPYGYAYSDEDNDQLWVREALYKGHWLGQESAAHYSADNMPVWDVSRPVEWPTWWTRDKQPAMFCPRGFSRIQLEITNVWVEQVKSVSEEDAKAEHAPHLTPPNTWGSTLTGHRAGFKKLWDSINAKRGYSWESNPWVWVVEFEVTQ